MSKQQVQRVKRPESRREELLEAALALFLKRGVTNVTVADITEAAGAAKGTFYRYFESREELTAALRDQFSNDFIAVAAERTGAASGDGWWAQVREFVDCFIEYGLKNRKEHEVLFHSSANSVHDQTDARLVEWLTSFFRAGVGASAFKVDDPGVVALLLVRSSHAVVDAAISRRYSRDRLTKALFDMYRKTLIPEAGE